MTTFTLDTAIAELPFFLRDVIETNLTDPLSSRTNPFVFKDAPEKNNEYPYIVVLLPDFNGEHISYDRTLLVNSTFTIEAHSISKGDNALYYRDKLIDDTRAILSDQSSADSDGDTISTNNLVPQDWSTNIEDDYNTDGEYIRARQLLFRMRYTGG